ncbi:MAG: cytidine deaminase [Eubacteriales bacterium]
MVIEEYKRSRYKSLVDSAKQAARKAYCPFSHFHVGAALLTADGSIYTGCNIENSSYGATICAERTAAVKAISEGSRSFSAIAVIGYHESDKNMNYCMPCGICRQFLAEFTEMSECEVVVADDNYIKVYTLSELLPEAFK